MTDKKQSVVRMDDVAQFIVMLRGQRVLLDSLRVKNMKSFIATICALFTTLLVGCATPNVGSDFSLKSDSNKGLVIGSITRTAAAAGEQGMSAYSAYAMMQYRNTTAGVDGKVESGSSALGKLAPGDFEGIDGNLFTMELPAGSYEFYRWFLTSAALSISPKSDFSSPFVVEPGKAVYVGEINFDVLYAKGMLGNAVFSDVAIKSKDSSQRDYALTAKRIPKLNTEQIEKRLLVLPAAGANTKN